MPRRILMLAALLAHAACRTESVTSLPGVEADVAYADAGLVYEVRESGVVRGYVVRFTEAGAGGRGFFSVRNPSHQELGLIDGQGRSYRYRAHERDPEWLGTGTVQEGVARILGLGEDTELVEGPGAVAPGAIPPLE